MIRHGAQEGSQARFGFARKLAESADGHWHFHLFQYLTLEFFKCFRGKAGNLEAARDHFADHCSSCHANDGSGDTMYGKGLYPKPPDLRQAETQNLSDGELFWIIENGVRFTGMPAFGGGHGSEDDSWKLVFFIRHLPQLHDEERLEMEKMNPKGPDDRDEEKDEDNFLGGTPAQQKAPAEHHH